MTTPTPIGTVVTLNADLLDLKARPHAYAGKRVTILSRARKAYVGDPGDDTVTVFHEGDFTVDAEPLSLDFIHVARINTQIITVAPGELVESPFNPRKTFNAEKLAELAASIKQVGIMQPLLVRPTCYTGGKPNTYEIVFGHRRYRAAVAAGLLGIPVMVRNLTDAQSARLQAIENLQREDLDPIEEAQGYADYCKAHKLNKQQLADYIGVSRTTVYNQLKLLDLCPEGQALVQRGVLGTELAMHVARTGDADVQAPALKKIFYGADLATATKDTKAMSLSQGMAFLAPSKGDKADAANKAAKAAEPARFDMLQHLARQRAFSEKTFGPGQRTQGVVDHIRKELIEVLANPGDLTEWIDVVILALDGAWRAGATPQQIITTLVAMQTKNEGRTWPDWRTVPADKAIEHDRSTDHHPV